MSRTDEARMMSTDWRSRPATLVELTSTRTADEATSKAVLGVLLNRPDALHRHLRRLKVGLWSDPRDKAVVRVVLDDLNRIGAVDHERLERLVDANGLCPADSWRLYLAGLAVAADHAIAAGVADELVEQLVRGGA